MGLPADAWVKNSLSFKFLALSKKRLLQSRGSGLMETYMQDQLLLGHGFSIPEAELEPRCPRGLDTE